MLKGRVVILSIILALAVVLPLVPGCSPLPRASDYAAVVPKVFRAGISQSISIALFNGSQPATGNVELLLTDKNNILMSVSSNVNGETRIPFNVPDVQEGEYTFIVKGAEFRGETQVQVQNSLLVFLETDKPIYKPGQTVHIRTLILSPDLLPVKEAAVIEIMDAKGIKIFRSNLETDDYGMTYIDLPISNEPNLGTWKINAVSGEAKTQLDFRVEEYVLPKYEIRLDLPKEWFLINESIPGNISAEYSFGKPVQGGVEIKAYKYVGTWQQYADISGAIDSDFDFVIPPANYVAGVPAAGGNGNVRLDVSVTEKSTGYTENTSRFVTLAESSVNVNIIPSAANFKPGLPFNILIVTQSPDNQLIDAQGVASIAYFDQYFNQISNQEINIATEKGKEIFETVPPANSILMQISTTAGGGQASKSLEAGYSPTGNFIHLEQITEGTTGIGHQIVFQVFSTQPATNFYYEVISRDQVVFSDYNHGGRISFITTPAMAPSPKLLVYQILPNGEVAADYLPFQVEAQYPQNVEISLSSNETAPGDQLRIGLQAEGQSKIGLVAVDKSVYILAENRLNLQQVFEQLEKLYMQPQAEIHEISPFQGISTRGTRETLNDAGVILLTNGRIPEGKEYQRAIPDFGVEKDGIMPPMAASGMTVTATTTTATANGPTQSQNLAEVQRVRQYFPETWLWENVTTDAAGKATLEVQVPDSITTWMFRAVAISPKNGLGIAESQLKVFQPFFLSVDLPYSAVRGEEFPVKVAVYNYLDQPQNITVQIDTAEWFDLLDNSSKTIEIKANDIGSVEFKIRPRIVGSNSIKVTARSPQLADAVVKTMLIEPEGVSREVVENITLSNGLSKQITGTFPLEAIPDSGRVYLTVTGSYLAQTMEGMESLLQMPFGCGEQNMINFAPDVYITRYLKESNQLKPEIMAKAELLMLTGYQRELTYRRNDGSFSAFGQSDKEGSLWLTSFVLKSFAQAKDIIYVDDNILDSAKLWIKNHQNADGSFDPVGFVHHQELIGGVTGKVALTAYVAIALLQSGENVAGKKSVAYLESKITETEDAYTMALISYALELAGSARVGDAYDKLMSMAQEDENGLYWETDNGIQESDTLKMASAAPQILPSPRLQTTGIETTAYATLALLEHGDVINSSKAARWLVSKRNAYGGYGSTQDTVVSLEALTIQATGSKADINLDIDVTNSSQLIKHFNLNPGNYDILQIIEIPANQELTINVRGKGEAIGQIVQRFNLPKADDTSEILKVQVNYDTTQVEVNDLVNVSVYLAFNPPLPIEAGMTVLDISVPTGFNAVKESIDALMNMYPKLKRYDISGRKVIFYIENMLPGDQLEFSFKVQAMYPVKAKGVSSRAYSYYNPEIEAETLGQEMTIN